MAIDPGRDVRGGAFGSLIADRIATPHPDEVAGIHLTDSPFPKLFMVDRASLGAAESSFYDAMDAWMESAVYFMVQSAEPLTLAYGLTDSPVGLLAWIADKFDAEANTDVANNNAIKDGWMGLDIGPQAQAVFAKIISDSRTILWNGPMGVFEMEKFSEGTRKVAEAVVAATQKGAFSLIGGGDSAAAVAKFGYNDDVSYVSTGGGALLEYFEGKVLPGVQALEE